MATVAGIDLSLTCTGYVEIDQGMQLVVAEAIRGNVGKIAKIRGIPKVAAIVARILEHMENGVQLVVLEGYAFGANRAAQKSGELAGVLKHELWRRDIPIILIPPTSLKLFAAGHGGADKGRMISCANQKCSLLNLDPKTSWHEDIADAYWDAVVAATYLGWDPEATVGQTNLARSLKMGV